MSLTISVIVPTFRRPDDLRRCLAGFVDQDRPADEILVVLRPEDHDGAAVCAALAETLPIRVVEVTRPGQVAALNAGRAAARGNVLAMTDDDAVPTPGWLAGIERYFGEPDVGAVGGRDVVYEGSIRVDPPEVRRVGRVEWYGRLIGHHHHPSRRQEVDFLKGANMAYRADALRPFDETLWGSGAQVCNDLEASLSVRARGWRVVFDPDVTVDHHPAPRHDDARAAPSQEAMAAAVHNELYALVLHLPAPRALSAAGYGLLVGRGSAPGLVRAAAGLVRTRDVAAARVALRLARARSVAIADAVRGRRKAGR